MEQTQHPQQAVAGCTQVPSRAGKHQLGQWLRARGNNPSTAPFRPPGPGKTQASPPKLSPLAAFSVPGCPARPSAHSAEETPHLCRLSHLLHGRGRALST